MSHAYEELDRRDTAIGELVLRRRLVPGLADEPVFEIKRDDEPWRRLLGSVLGKTLFSERLTLDGVLSLWQPQLK